MRGSALTLCHALALWIPTIPHEGGSLFFFLFEDTEGPNVGAWVKASGGEHQWMQGADVVREGMTQLEAGGWDWGGPALCQRSQWTSQGPGAF